VGAIRHKERETPWTLDFEEQEELNLSFEYP
jgi:hypothetical protein